MANPKRKALVLRIDPRLWVELEALAQQEFRSVNGQIEYLLRDAVLRRKRNANVISDSEDQQTNTDSNP